MSTVRLSDVQFDPDVYMSYVQENRTDKNAFIASGVAVTNTQLQQRATGDGDITTVPYWKDLDATSENISSDDPAVYATPDKITTGKMVARRAHLNKAWQTANLVGAVMGTEDPMSQIATRTAAYWDQRFADRIQKTVLGIYLDNIAANSGDMTFDISTQDGANATSANLFNFGGFVDAIATMGESDDQLAMLGVHPHTMAQMRKNQEIDFIQDTETGILIPTYNGKRVFVDKKLPVIAGTTSGSRYVSVLYGAGAIGYGMALPARPVATEYDELAGNGAGVETLVERKQWIIHPEGYKWTETTVAGLSPTVAEVALAANWERVFNRENIKLAFFVHN